MRFIKHPAYIYTLALLLWAGSGVFFCLHGVSKYGQAFNTVVRYKSAIPRSPKRLPYSIWRTGPIDVAKVFGRSNGCRDADSDLINLIVKKSVSFNIDPRLTASVIVQESQCDPLAVSYKGAIGMMQVMPKIHQDQFDFSEVNLFNPEDNIQTGLKILSNLINQYGETEALRRYQGIGPGGVENYSSQVLGRKNGF